MGTKHYTGLELLLRAVRRRDERVRNELARTPRCSIAGLRLLATLRPTISCDPESSYTFEAWS